MLLTRGGESLLGSGKRLFTDGTGATRFELVETKPTGEVVTLTLRRAEEES